jgi:hypothetical protein
MHNFKISVCYKSNFCLFKNYKSDISHFVSSLLCLPCSGDPNATSRGADWILNCQIQFPNKATFGFQIRQNLIFKFEHSHWPGKWYNPLKSTKHTRGQGRDQKKLVKNKTKNYGEVMMDHVVFFRPILFHTLTINIRILRTTCVPYRIRSPRLHRPF